MFDDLAPFRAVFPDWEAESRWLTVNSGPDQRLYLAHRGGVIVTAFSVDDLAAQVAAAGIAAALREDDGQ